MTTYGKNVWVGDEDWRPVIPNKPTPSHCICKINEWTWICWSPNNPITRRVNPKSKRAGWPASSTLQHQWRDREQQKGGGGTDISGNRLDNRHTHWGPVPCTGTRWLVEGTRSPAQGSFPWAAPLPRATPAPPSPAAGISLERWSRDLRFRCGHRADQRHQEEAGGQQCSSFAAPALVRTWGEESRVKL